MPVKGEKLIVAISSRALFDFEAENELFDACGIQEYQAFQLERLHLPANKGVAFELARKLLSFNTDDNRRVEIVVLSRNDPVSGLRVFNSAAHHGLDLIRGAFVRGTSPYPYLQPLRADLFLSANAEDVKEALENHVPAARAFARGAGEAGAFPNQLRIAFDGDSVLFSDEAERVYRSDHLAGFAAHEQAKARTPLPPGPIQPFLSALNRLKSNPPPGVATTIRTALMTARGAPAQERALRTLMSWNIEIDEAFFLGGLPKEEFLAAFQPDFFFDDQLTHCKPASALVSTGHVDYGIANEPAS
jgi:5'-nucleotidase